MPKKLPQKKVVNRADRVRRGSGSMRRSTRLSRSSTMSSDLPVVDENSAFVANSKDFSDRSSSASTRKSEEIVVERGCEAH